jgi:hypothetical protein
MLVGNTCDSAHGVYIVGGFHTPNLIGYLDDDIIGPPCEHPINHTHSMILILMLRSIIMDTSICGISTMLVVSWCKGVYPVPD